MSEVEHKGLAVWLDTGESKAIWGVNERYTKGAGRAFRLDSAKKNGKKAPPPSEQPTLKKTRRFKKQVGERMRADWRRVVPGRARRSRPESRVGKSHCKNKRGNPGPTASASDHITIREKSLKRPTDFGKANLPGPVRMKQTRVGKGWS